MPEEGVDEIHITPDIEDFEGFDLKQCGAYDTNQLLRYLIRFQAQLKDFKFYVKKYRKGEPINICIPETRFTNYTELLILMDKKYFPELTATDEYIETGATNVMYNDHFLIAFEFINPINGNKKLLSFYFCPFDIIYDKKTREIFMGLAATSFAKNKQGVTEYDKTHFKVVFHEKEQFKELYKTNLEELTHEVEDEGKMIYYASTDAIVTLPFLNAYERLRQVIASRKIVLDDEIGHLDDDQLYNLRFKKLLNNQPLPQWHYKENFILDLDYCRSCLRYSE